MSEEILQAIPKNCILINILNDLLLDSLQYLRENLHSRKFLSWLFFFANKRIFFCDSFVQKTYPVIKYGGEWERERVKKNHIISFDIYRIVSSSSMICRISHYFPVFGNQKRVKACDLHANTSKRVEIHVFFELNMQITSRPWYGYVCM